MAYQCHVCNGWTADSQKHECVYDDLKRLEDEVKALKKKIVDSTPTEVQLQRMFLECELGLYKIGWRSGGCSLVAIGNDRNGNRWMAPTNWTCDSGANPTALLSKFVGSIESMTLLFSNKDRNG